MVGRIVSHYRIQSKLGAGGMGVVYKAEDTKLERTVALKFLAPHLVADEALRKRFEQEAEAVAALDHSNICTVFEIDEAEGSLFLAMAFVEGPTVKERIAQRPLKLEEALEIATQTAEGLRAAHQKGIVHRDIKPANVMINPQQQVKIMDLGLARLSDATVSGDNARFSWRPAGEPPLCRFTWCTTGSRNFAGASRRSDLKTALLENRFDSVSAAPRELRSSIPAH